MAPARGSLAAICRLKLSVTFTPNGVLTRYREGMQQPPPQQPSQQAHQTPRGGHSAGVPGAPWDAETARAWIPVPGAGDHKYSRGVLGVVTGSNAYPGAAVLGVEAAHRTGIGMVRYLGPERAADFVLARRPETVTQPGRVAAWLLGSGTDAGALDPGIAELFEGALASGVPVVLDAGALGLALGAQATGVALVLTPHHRELSQLLAGASRTAELSLEEISSDPASAALYAAELFGATVLLKGPVSWVAAPGREPIQVASGTPWLATAGTGDVLAGVLGALLATHPQAAYGASQQLAATAAFIHGLAGSRAARGGPITALDVAETLPATIATLLAG